VRLLFNSNVVRRGDVKYESIEGQFASIGDPHLVVKRVSVSGHERGLLEEWERNALNGESIWDLAEAELIERLSLAPTT
jgi:hypothetical protein